MSSAGTLFTAILRQWGCAIDPKQDPRAAAELLKGIKGAGVLHVTTDVETMHMPCESVYEASFQVLMALTALSIDSLICRQDLLAPIRPEFFAWVPHKRDVVETPDAKAVINKIKEGIK